MKLPFNFSLALKTAVALLVGAFFSFPESLLRRLRALFRKLRRTMFRLLRRPKRLLQTCHAQRISQEFGA